jgi:uncharacterized protein
LKKKTFKRLCQFILFLFLLLNVLAFAGAYAFTHYTPRDDIGFGQSRPINTKFPSDIQLDYITQRIPINANEWIETWFIDVKKSKSQGMVILFPGNGGSKANLLAPAQVFHNLGYDTLLVDFRGVGGSTGDTTTVGMREAKDVAVVMGYVHTLKPNQPIILYGVSMGSVAILKALAEEYINPSAIIIELPFARFLDAVRSRFRAIKVPDFPIAELVVFWGSVQHGFNGFTHNPVTYASQVKCPTLLLHGELDKWVTVAEINEIFQNLRGDKKLVIFSNAGHNLLVTMDKALWTQSINQFLKGI